MTSGDFNGYVSDGYLRKGDPTGTKVEFKDGNTAPYDFQRTYEVPIGHASRSRMEAFKRT